MRLRAGARALGGAWEDRARKYLCRQGLGIIARGYACRMGEIDILATDGEGLIVIEVRARGRAEFGTALETVDARKQRRIVNATRHFLMCNPSWYARPIRFDVIAIDGSASSEPRITWVRNAFQVY